MQININNTEQYLLKLYNYLCKHKMDYVKVSYYTGKSFLVEDFLRSAFIEYSKTADCIYINNVSRTNASALSIIDSYCDSIRPFTLNVIIKYFNLLLKCDLI